MPQEPKKRHSRQRKGKRRASINHKVSSYVSCLNCGNKILSHSVCKLCGFYKGKEVIRIKKKSDQKDKK